MKRYVSVAFFMSVSVLSACLNTKGNKSKSPKTKIESVYTNFSVNSCKKVIDQDDPNETPFRLCPGVAGYTLFVRHVGSGRQSIGIAPPSLEEIPLNYHEVVTRHMLHLDDKAEWRVLINNEKKIPIALIVKIYVHENHDKPEKATSTYFALAKITKNKICVTDKIIEGSLSKAEVRKLADTARSRKCTKP